MQTFNVQVLTPLNLQPVERGREFLELLERAGPAFVPDLYNTYEPVNKPLDLGRPDDALQSWRSSSVSTSAKEARGHSSFRLAPVSVGLGTTTSIWICQSRRWQMTEPGLRLRAPVLAVHLGPRGLRPAELAPSTRCGGVRACPNRRSR